MNILQHKKCRIFFIIVFVFLPGSIASADTSIYNWNESIDSRTTWTDWTWYPSGANDYGAVGFRKDDGHFYSGDSNWYPRIHEKNDYGQSCLASIDSENIAPSTSTGGSLKVYDDGTGSTQQASYWYMWGDNLGTHGFADSNTDRMDFYLKVNGAAPVDLSAGKILNANMHLGTYLCWEGGGPGGEDCPVESGNQHYYHYMTLPFGDMPWVHVQIDQHPTHLRNATEPNEPDNDPAYSSRGQHYFESMNTFYLEVRYDQPNLTYYLIDEVNVWNQSQDENEDSIGSQVWVGYWPSTNKWQMGFGSVWPGRPMMATFEVRWSTSPITNANYSSATVAEPEYRERGSSNTFTLSDGGWSKQAWTQFEIPQSTVESVDKIYFAIRDVSLTANGDGYNSPTKLIKTIDYALSASSTKPTTVMPPGNLLLNSSN
ncbi:hypothetical protein [uncultured Desulfuromusa sp.]|uniref:hypothetical protein n=1 Tax=uncultured Desulfuromusa sp. TaxID=219183 RepID=UPI002AA8728E|nr:hypothetical protein [uncultured Desulfuromusa sp.]